jgi:23S rRNA (cytosine1962-C5)-methyltransferase
MNPRVVLRPRRARPFYGRHPWMYAGAVAGVEGEPEDGALVDLVSHDNIFVARGIYNSKSKIRVRLYTWDEGTALDEGFFRDRIAEAVRLRSLMGMGGSSCRLIFSEGDGLSGFTVDRYDRWLVVQFTALGMACRREMLAELLAEQLQPDGIYLRTERGIGRLEGLELHDGPLWGKIPEGPVTIEENGVKFLVNFVEGQKTGFYLDQRDNRQAVARLAVGRRVLDAFCFTGGFGLHAARAGALAVLGVDQSPSALELAQANARLNGLENVELVQDDVFDRLEALKLAGERFGLVVLDPPKFARARHAVEEALRGYRRLQTLALPLLEPGGFLVTCCCSGLITVGMLEEVLALVAAESRREVRLLEVRGAAPDHPVSVSCLESQYLKCMIAHVR